MMNFSDLPEKERGLITPAGKGGNPAGDMAITEAIVRNTIATDNLKDTIVQLNTKNDEFKKSCAVCRVPYTD